MTAPNDGDEADSQACGRFDPFMPAYGAANWQTGPVRQVVRRSATVVALFIVLSGCSGSSNWLAFRGKQGRGFTSTHINTPIAMKWKLQLQYDSDSQAESFNPPIIYDDTIYFGSDDGNFYALDIESGYMRWVFNTDGAINSVPTADEEYVYFGSNDGFFYCVSREDGAEIWSFDTQRLVQSSTALYNESVVFTSDVGATYVIDRDGVERHRIENRVWLYHTFQIFEDVMYFAPGPASDPYSLGAYDMTTQSYLWWLDTRSDNATWYSFPALRGDDLFYSTAAYPTRDFDLTYYGLDRWTGEVNWIYRDTSKLGPFATISEIELFRRNLRLLDHMAPSLYRNIVIFTSGDRTVRAFDQKSGDLAWTNAFQYPTSSAPSVAGSRVYFGVHGDNLSNPEMSGVEGLVQPKMVALSARNGSVVWSIDIEGSLLSAPVISGKWIVFGTDENVFYVLEEAL